MFFNLFYFFMPMIYKWHPNDVISEALPTEWHLAVWAATLLGAASGLDQGCWSMRNKQPSDWERNLFRNRTMLVKIKSILPNLTGCVLLRPPSWMTEARTEALELFKTHNTTRPWNECWAFEVSNSQSPTLYAQKSIAPQELHQGCTLAQCHINIWVAPIVLKYWW